MQSKYKKYYVYLLTNKNNTVIYTGVTNDIERRIMEHKQGLTRGFTWRYNVHKLVYFEEYNDIEIAIAREKQIKAGSRKKKIDMIQSMNPSWRDLYEDFV